jgi:hypothetical protein
VHVHTRASHDSPGTLEQVVAGARAGGVRWVALTEHPGGPGQAAAHEVDGVVLIPGYEINVAGGTLLAVGLREPPPRRLPPGEVVERVRAAGAVALVSHLERSALADPDAFRDADPDGVEIANLHAVAETRRTRLALALLALPGPLALRQLLRVPDAQVARWRALHGARAFVGSVDAHAKFRAASVLGGTMDRYRDLFRLVTTHALARDASADAILEALRAGRTYVAFEGLARVDAFRFEPVPGGFLVAAPRRARLALVCDGQQVDSRLAAEARLVAPASARRCSAEAWLDGRIWVVTSPAAPLQR